MNTLKLLIPLLGIIAIAFLLHGCSSNTASADVALSPATVKSERIGLAADMVYLYRVKVTEHYSCKVIVSYDASYPVVFFNSCVN